MDNIYYDGNLKASLTVGNVSDVNPLNTYNKDEVNQLLENKSDINHTHDEYLTEHQDISHLALKSEVPNMRVIGNGVDEYIFKGNEFTDEEYENAMWYTVYLKNVWIGDVQYYDDLVAICVWLQDDVKCFDVTDQYGNYNAFSIDNDGNLTEDIESRDNFVWQSDLDLALEGAMQNTVQSYDIKQIKVVDELPEVEEEGILYLVRESGE